MFEQTASTGTPSDRARYESGDPPLQITKEERLRISLAGRKSYMIVRALSELISTLADVATAKDTGNCSKFFRMRGKRSADPDEPKETKITGSDGSKLSIDEGVGPSSECRTGPINL